MLQRQVWNCCQRRVRFGQRSDTSRPCCQEILCHKVSPQDVHQTTRRYKPPERDRDHGQSQPPQRHQTCRAHRDAGTLLFCPSIVKKKKKNIITSTSTACAYYYYYHFFHNTQHSYPDGELFKIILRRGTFSEQDAVDIVRQMVEGLRYLHSNGIAHRDIKVTKQKINQKKKFTNESTPIAFVFIFNASFKT